jgi:hypothetical protein
VKLPGSSEPARFVHSTARARSHPGNQCRRTHNPDVSSVYALLQDQLHADQRSVQTAFRREARLDASPALSDILSKGASMVPHFLRTLLQRGAKLSAWMRLADVEVELLRCHHPARCSHAGCGDYRATTIVRYLDAKGRPLHHIAEVCDEHADLIKGEQSSGAKVRDLRGFSS